MDNIRFCKSGTRDGEYLIDLVCVGDNVKALYGIERLWVLVSKIEKGKFIGNINNIPVDPLACGVNCGDKVVVNHSDVLDVILQGID